MMVGGRTQRDPGATMADNVNDLVLDLLEWLGSWPRPYVEVLDAWRTSCPRLPVWEEANERGFIERVNVAGRGQCVAVSEVGTAHLRRARPRHG
jgi:D-3-phosphoglycerate dehydrogenase / 2-oxoglutarate reductase